MIAGWIVGLLIFSPLFSARELRLAMKNPTSLEVRDHFDLNTQSFFRLVGEGLMRIGKDGNPEPGLAEKMEVFPDQALYIFRLRKDLRWSNGEPLTAQDFVRSWQEVFVHDFRARGFFTLLKNAQKILAGTLPPESLGVRAVDEETLSVELEHYTPFFPEYVAHPCYCPVADLSKNLDRFGKPKRERVWSGPFYLKGWIIGEKALLARNPHYWDLERVKLQEITVQFVANPELAWVLFQRKAIDFIGGGLSQLPLSVTKQNFPNQKWFERPTYALYLYFLNEKSVPLSNRAFRKLLAYSLRRKEWTEKLLENDEAAAYRCFHPEMALHSIPFFEEWEDGKLLWAWRELEKSLREENGSLPSLSISYNTLSSLHEQVQEEWRKKWGLSITLQPVDIYDLFDALSGKREFDILGIRWPFFVRDPVDCLLALARKKGGGGDPQLIALLEKARQEGSLEKRERLCLQAEEKMYADFSILPLFFFHTIPYLKHPELKGEIATALGGIYFKEAFFED